MIRAKQHVLGWAVVGVVGFLCVTDSAVAQVTTQPAYPSLEHWSSARARLEIESLIVGGRLGEAERLLRERVRAKPTDDLARFQAGIVRFLRGVEDFAQAMHRHGLRIHGIVTMALPGTRLPIPENPNPQPISYAEFRSIVEAWSTSLYETSELLDGLSDTDVRFPLHFGLIRLDLDGDGRTTEPEALWRIYAELNAGVRLNESNASDFVISFDRADAEWLKGYCHVLMAMNDFLLAHDFHELFDRTAHLLFPKVESPYAFLTNDADAQGYAYPSVVDFVAYIHLINFEVTDGARLARARDHLQTVISTSRRMWEFVNVETDDDREWIPSPRQTGVIPNVRVTEEQIVAWHGFLDELDAILAGKKLVPFWRDAGGRGVNVARVFTEPRTFDLVLWVQGSAALPYLETGPLTEVEIWRGLQIAFGGGFFNFAVWWN